jgi:hypothetical protein
MLRLEAATPATGALAKPRSERSAYKKFLYRILGWGVILALFAPAVVMTAQEERPQITPREKPKTKKDNSPRALGLLRLNSSGKATLVPIVILVNGKLYDASAYKADPIPMALESGTVYEAERSGDSQGLFTVNGAIHSRDPGSQYPWVGSGSYLANGSERPKQAHKAEDVPVGMENDNGPPRLSKGDKPKPVAAPENAPSNPPAGTGSSEKPGAPPSTSSTTPGDSSASQPTQADAPASSANPAGQTPDQTAGKPADQTSPQATGQTAAQPAKDQPTSQAPASQSPDDSYRPTLRRGKPTQPMPGDDETAPKARSAKATDAKAADAKTTTPAASSVAVELMPAISDAGGPDPKSYKFEWRKGEEDDRRQQMLALARDELRAYLNQQAQAIITLKPAAEAGAKSAAKSSAPGRKPARKQTQPALENVQFKSFDVWDNNDPVMVLTAEASAPAPSGSAAATAEPLDYTITLVARTDIYSKLHKLYWGITDKYHLDLTPRLELIDAVDADGDGRGELLFHETTDAGSGYVIYRATADTLWKMFDSLHPE